EGWAAVVMFLITAIVVSQLSLRARQREAEALARKDETECLYSLGQALLGLDRFETVVWTVANQIVPIFHAQAAGFYIKSTGDIHQAGSQEVNFDALKLAECADAQKILRDAPARLAYTAVTLDGQSFGSIGIAGARLSDTVLKAIT